jgi:signal transduction histidine kinase
MMSPASALRLRRLSVRRSDVIATAVIAIPVISSLVYRAAQRDQPLVLLLVVAALGAVLLRDRQPVAALLVAIAVRSAIPDDQALVLPALAVLYTIASRRSWPMAAAGAALVTLVALVAGAGWGTLTDHGGLLGYAIETAASSAAAVALGLYVGARRRVIDGLRERAERLDRERELLADRAVAQERVRIAQELHDVIAHNVSLMVVQAQALGADVDDQRVLTSTDAIADLGRQAMAEMHRTLRLLRTGDSEGPALAPNPGLANLDKLLEQARSAGLNIELTVEGQPRQLPPTEDLSAYRIVQEALTNVVKHAAGAQTSVTLAYQAAGLELTIADSGEANGGEARTPPAPGHGLVGMSERASLFGGTLTAQPGPDHGFVVTAMLPYAEGDS